MLSSKSVVLDEMKKKFSKYEFENFISKLQLDEKNSNDDYIILIAPNLYLCKFINTKFSKKLANFFENLNNIKPKIIITTLNQKIQKKSEIKTTKPKNSVLLLNQNFNNFIVGKSNSFAYQTAKMVAQNPGKNYNPLFIYGPSGLGKTHLLNSIGNYCIEQGLSVICITSEQFANDLKFHIDNKIQEKFKNKYRNCDILLIDDIQFLGSRNVAKEEFFHNFDELKNKNCQIVITSDRAPIYLKDFEDRLITRFGSGLKADITPPDLDTKIAIIEQKNKENEYNFDKEIIEYIAVNMVNNIREIEGALVTLNSFSTMWGKITLENAKIILKDMIIEKKGLITIDDIINTVSKELNIKPNDIKSKAKNKNIVEARRICIYLTNELTIGNFKAFATYFGLKDHSAISKNLKSIKKLIDSDEYLKIKIEELKNKIQKEKIK